MAPLLTYKDLAREDIALLTEVLDHVPVEEIQPEDSEISTAQELQRSLVAGLPSHLKSWVSCMAPGCSDHKQLNLAPLDDLAGEFEHEVFHSMQTIWLPLYTRASFSQEQLDMLHAMEWISTLASERCSACWLQYLGSNPYSSVALGAFIIGRINPSIYQKSKRVIWIESMLRQRLDNRTAAIEIPRMWEAGIEFRRMRKAVVVEFDEGRHVADYVRRARDLDAAPSVKAEPAMSPRSEATSAMEEWLEHLPRTEANKADAASVQSSIPRMSTSQTTKPSLQPAVASSIDDEERTSAKAASTMKSTQGSTASWLLPRSSDPSARWRFPKHASVAPSTGTGFIDLYRQSNFSDNTAFDARSSTDTRKRSPVFVFGRPPPEEVQQRSSSRHGSGLDQSVAPPVPWPPERDSIRQKRQETKYGKAVPYGWHPEVDSRGLQPPKQWYQ